MADGERHGYHYGVIARAIAEIDAAGGERVTLEDLAARMGMSAAHFQRVFTQWVGVSPKRFQQYLALGQARRMLAERFTVLEAAQEAGLSGGGRLHDLFLRWEAMTPGEYARGGAGIEIGWGWFDSAYGPALVMATARGLCGIGFAGVMGQDAVLEDMRARWPAARFVEDPQRLRGWAEAALGGDGSVPLHLMGAPFQIKVWEALLAIPEGRVTTYGEIARAVGKPSAARAVGAAVGRNPVSLLIPCHRAIAQSGALTGYHWGLPIKRAMLAREAARAEAREVA